VARQRGIVLLALLFILALVGVGMGALGTNWRLWAQREKEAQLLFVGGEFARAIQSYRQRGPGADKRGPGALADLLEDHRFPYVVRHLRRIYPDPVTGRVDWGLVRDAQGNIAGVYSPSDAAPLKVAGFPAAYAAFEGKSHYRDWVFVPAPPATDRTGAAKGTAGGPGPGGAGRAPAPNGRGGA
jgi:type II secretory pathway pseudopilin PulG